MFNRELLLKIKTLEAQVSTLEKQQHQTHMDLYLLLETLGYSIDDLPASRKMVKLTDEERQARRQAVQNAQSQQTGLLQGLMGGLGGRRAY